MERHLDEMQEQLDDEFSNDVGENEDTQEGDIDDTHDVGEGEFQDSQSDDEEDIQEPVHQEQDEEEYEEVKPNKKRDKAKTRINQIQREKYRALHVAEKLKEENEQLKKLLDTSSQVAIKQYDDIVNRKVEEARQSKIQAIESGDPIAITDADARFTLAVNELHQLNDMKARQEYERSQKMYQSELEQQQPPMQDYQPYVEDWLERNEWFNPESDNFDEDLSTKVDAYTKRLNSELIRSGYQHAILSPEYFAEIDRVAQSYQAQRNSTQRGGLNMRQAKGGPHSARRATSQQSQGQPMQRRESRLSADEREMARLLKVSDEVYLKQRELDEHNNGQRRRGGR